MSIQNHAIVFGQTLFGQVGLGKGSSMAGHGNGVMTDAPFQSGVIIWSFCLHLPICSYSLCLQAIEMILEHYFDIFVDETVEASA